MKYYRQHDIEERGTIRRLSYESTDDQGVKVLKYANIYLPYGYDESADRAYNVLYVMHGGGGNPDAWLDSCLIKNELDFAFSEKEAEPFIVVFPTYYKRGAKADQKPDAGFSYANEQILFFQKELREDLIPAVESSCRTFAYGDVSEESLRASRTHRAFSGFSMGGGTTWYAFTENLDITAIYEVTTYTVTFTDGVTGDVIGTDTVTIGSDATFPAPPEHEGYDFIGWDGDGKNITADTTITAATSGPPSMQ